MLPICDAFRNKVAHFLEEVKLMQRGGDLCCSIIFPYMLHLVLDSYWHFLLGKTVLGMVILQSYAIV